MYYTINETAARRAKEANSFSDYKPGSATAEYQKQVDEAVKIAEKQKQRVDSIHHGKINNLLTTYCRKLADNMNKSYEIEARVASVLIAGASNFPVRKKAKQNAARDRNMQEWRDINGLLDKIRGTGMGGISADDPDAVNKLKSKLSRLELNQELMKDVNAYYKRHKTLEGCAVIDVDTQRELKAAMTRHWRGENAVPFESYALSNNNAEIRRLRERIAGLEKRATSPVPEGWTFEGGEVIINTVENRLQVRFDGKPDEKIRAMLKANGFRWAPSQSAWQRQYTDNALRAAKRIECINPGQ